MDLVHVCNSRSLDSVYRAITDGSERRPPSPGSLPQYGFWSGLRRYLQARLRPSC